MNVSWVSIVDLGGRHLRLSTRVFVKAAVCVLLWESGVTAALARDGAAQQTDGTELTEIVVTAERREATVQTTPISITALSGADLQLEGITSAQEIATRVPGLSIASAGPGNAVYQIRGLTSAGGESSTVGFYFDDIPITQPSNASLGKVAIDPDLYDLQRVEVLRGPQGTLYGAGSMGGTIKLIMSSPDVSGLYGSGETIGSGTQSGGANYGQNGMANIPLNDTTAVRLVGSYMHTSGWIGRVVVPNMQVPSNGGLTRDNVLNVPGSRTYTDVNDEDRYSGRASLLFHPGNLSVEPTVFYQDIHTGGMTAYDSTPGTLAHYQPYDISEPSSDKFFLSSLPITYDFNGFSITSVSGYWNRHQKQLQDGTEQVQSLFGTPSFDPALGGIGPAQLFEQNDTHQYSTELRAASTGTGRLTWLVGAFYSQYYTQFNLGVASAPDAAALLGSSDLFTGEIATDIKQKAAFAHLTYQITPKLKAEAGARYFSYDDTNTLTTGGVAYGAVPPTPPQVGVAGGSDSGVNPMFNVSYSPSSNAMIYATASKGFREGGGNYPIPTDNASPLGPGCLADLKAIGRNGAPLQYGPDSVWNYEIGEKSQFFKNRLQVNADAYYLRWSSVQSFVPLAAPEPCNMYFTDNGANATVKGGELEVQALLATGLQLTLNVGYTDAAYSASDPASAIVEGQRLYDVPEWTSNVVLKYGRPMGRFDLFALIENSFASNTQEMTYQLQTLPSRDLTNIRLGLKTHTWSAVLFVDNVFNRQFPMEYLNLIALTAPPYSRIATNQPLTAGVDLSYQF